MIIYSNHGHLFPGLYSMCRYDIKGYPTLKFKKKGKELQDYEGKSNLEGLIEFSNRMSGKLDESPSLFDYQGSTIVLEEEICVADIPSHIYM